MGLPLTYYQSLQRISRHLMNLIGNDFQTAVVLCDRRKNTHHWNKETCDTIVEDGTSNAR